MILTQLKELVTQAAPRPVYWINANDSENMANVFFLDVTTAQTFIDNDNEMQAKAECVLYMRSHVNFECIGEVANVLRKCIRVNDDTTARRVDVNRKDEKVSFIAGGAIETSMQFTFHTSFEYNKAKELLKEVKFN